MVQPTFQAPIPMTISAANQSKLRKTEAFPAKDRAFSYLFSFRDNSSMTQHGLWILCKGVMILETKHCCWVFYPEKKPRCHFKVWLQGFLKVSWPFNRLSEFGVQVRKKWGHKKRPIFQLRSFSTTWYGVSYDGMHYLISQGRVGRSRSPPCGRQTPNRSWNLFNNFNSFQNQQQQIFLHMFDMSEWTHLIYDVLCHS